MTPQTEQMKDQPMSTPNELQNCPFCGDRVVLCHSHVAGEGDWIEHAGPSCGLEFSSLTPDETLADRWNKRADIEPLIRSHEALKDALASVLLDLHNQKTAWGDTAFLRMANDRAKAALAAAKEVSQ